MGKGSYPLVRDVDDSCVASHGVGFGARCVGRGYFQTRSWRRGVEDPLVGKLDKALMARRRHDPTFGDIQLCFLSPSQGTEMLFLMELIHDVQDGPKKKEAGEMEMRTPRGEQRKAYFIDMVIAERSLVWFWTGGGWKR